MRTIARKCLIAILPSLLLATPAGAASDKGGPARTPPLATREQLAGERMLLKLLSDPQVRTLRDSLGSELAASPLADSPDAKSRAPFAVRLWTNSLILREYAAGLAQPAILWTNDNTPHSWFGHTIEGTGIAGDNPDHIYRYAALDGSGRYVIDGWIDRKHPPVQFSFEATHGTPATFGASRSSKSPDMGDQIGMLTDRDIQVEKNGHFQLTIGGPAGGKNHLPLAPGSVSLNVRDVVSDWSQRPIRMTIRRIDRGSAKPLSYAELKGRILQDLPDYIHTWSSFHVGWLGGIKPNTIVGPVGRDGGWGYLAGGRFSLAPGEAIQITTTRGPAAYTGVQVTDLWMIAPDGSRHLTSLNTSQARPNRDGTYTYVASPEDPGVANWIDTGGLRDGYLILRWQQVPVGPKPEGLLREYKVIRIKDGLPAGVPLVTPGQRAAQMAKHRANYANRIAPTRD